MPKRETIERDIKVRDEVYHVATTPLHVTRQLRLAPKLLRVVAPMLTQMKGVKAKGLMGAMAERDVADLGPALEAMCEHLDDAAVDKISLELLAGTTVIIPSEDGGQPRAIDLISPQMIDMAFQGDLEFMMAVLKFAGEVNFARYFFGRGRSTPPTPTPSE